MMSGNCLWTACLELLCGAMKDQSLLAVKHRIIGTLTSFAPLKFSIQIKKSDLLEWVWIMPDVRTKEYSNWEPNLRNERVWTNGQTAEMTGPSEGCAGLGHRKQLIWEPIQIQCVLWKMDRYAKWKCCVAKQCNTSGLGHFVGVSPWRVVRRAHPSLWLMNPWRQDVLHLERLLVLIDGWAETLNSIWLHC